MARHNIVLGNDRAFTGTYAGFGDGARVDDRQQQDPYGSQTGYAQPQYDQPQYGQQAPASRESLEAMYARPSASGHDTGRMTMRDALNAITATLGIIIVVGFAVGLAPLALGAALGEQGTSLGMLIAMGSFVIGMIGGVVLGLVNAFKRQPSAILVLAYALFQGLALGGISTLIDAGIDGPSVALQAVLGTLVVAGSVLVLFRMGVLRTSPRLTKIFMVAMVAYLVFGLVNIGLMIFTGVSLHDGMLGIVIGALAILMASYSLVMDFEDVQNGVNNGVPRVFAWRCAFGLAATLVWMYLEILRLISIFRSN